MCGPVKHAEKREELRVYATSTQKDRENTEKQNEEGKATNEETKYKEHYSDGDMTIRMALGICILIGEPLRDYLS